MALGRGYMAIYIGGSINSRPTDQTNLNKQCRYNLGGGGELTFKGKDDMWGPQAGRPVGGAGGPHMLAPRGLLWWVALWSVLESFHIGFAVDKHDLL